MVKSAYTERMARVKKRATETSVENISLRVLGGGGFHGKGGEQFSSNALRQWTVKVTGGEKDG